MTSLINQLMIISATSFFLFLAHFNHFADAQGLGVTISRHMQNVPAPKAILWLLKQKNIRRVKIFDAYYDRDLLEAVRDTGIAVLVVINDNDVYRIAADVYSHEATKWLEYNIKPYAESVNFRCIQVGQRMAMQGNRAISATFQAVVHLKNAQKVLGLDISLAIMLDTTAMAESFPPSAASFDKSILPVLRPMLLYLEHNMGSVVVNIYPMIRYVTDVYYEYKGMPVDFALLSSQTVAFKDNGLEYTNMMDSLLDAFYTCLSKLGISMRVLVGETGWPSSDGPRYATQKLAGEFLYNLAQRLKNNVGTPLKPNWAAETFIHTLYVQDKYNNGMDKWYGLFNPNGSPANPYLSL